MDIARGELVERELDTMIERRSRQKDPATKSKLRGTETNRKDRHERTIDGRGREADRRALRPLDPSGGRGRGSRAAAHSHRSRAIGGVLMPHLYKRPANHWKTTRRFDRRVTEQEESQPLRQTGRPRSLKDITKPRRAPWK